jgi:hypothetical protein
MRCAVVAMLVLASWAQVGGQRRARLEPPRDRVTVRVATGRGQRPRSITVERDDPLAPVDEDEDAPPPPVRHFNINTAVVERENFDAWLFDDGGQDERARWRRLETILLARVEEAARENELTGAERAKLRAAGKGDIKRFFDQVEDRRRDFEVDRRTFRKGLAALRGLEPLSQIYGDGPFGDGSLFAKTLRKINDDRKAGP